MKALLITVVLVLVAASGTAKATKAQTTGTSKSAAVAYCATYQYVAPSDSGVTNNAASTKSGNRHQGSDQRLPMLYKGL